MVGVDSMPGRVMGGEKTGGVVQQTFSFQLLETESCSE